MPPPVDDDGFRKLYNAFAIVFPLVTLLSAGVGYAISCHIDGVANTNVVADLLKNISYSIAAAAFISFFSLYFGGKYFLSAFKRHEDVEFASLIATTIAGYADSGVRHTEKGLDAKFVSEMIRTSSETTIIETWIDEQTLQSIEAALMDAFTAGNSIHVILLHPNSPQVQRRGKGTSEKPAIKKNRICIIDTLIDLKEIRDRWIKESSPKSNLGKSLAKVISRKSDPKFKVSCYDCLPPLQLYMWKDRASAGFYLQGKASSTGYQLRMDLKKGFGLEIANHINLFLQDGNLIEVDLNQSIAPQFDKVHLPIQLRDAAAVMTNLNQENLGLLAQMITDRSKNDVVRKKTMVDFCNEMLNILK